MKLKRMLCAALALCMLALPLTGCTNKDKNDGDIAPPATNDNQDNQNKSGPIAIVVPAAEHGWMAGIAYFAEQKCKELGLNEGDGYKLVTSSNANEQANQIDEMISLKPAAIVLLPHNDEVSVAAQKIVDKDIPLVVFDRKVDADYTAYVAGDNPDMGAQSAEYMGEKLGGKGTIAVLNVPSSGSVSTERVDAFKKVMSEKYKDIKLVDITAADFTQEAGLKTAADALVANQTLDAIFSIDDESSLGILQAIREAKRTDIKYLSGGGGGQAYFQKIQTETAPECFTATYSPSMIGDAVELAKDIKEGKKVEKENIIPPDIVTKDNVSKFLDKNSPY